MKISFTRKAQSSLQELASYLLQQQLSARFVRNHLENLHAAMVSLLETFPDAGVPTVVGTVTCRKLVVKGYNVLYQHKSETAQVVVLLIYRENIPLLD